MKKRMVVLAALTSTMLLLILLLPLSLLMASPARAEATSPRPAWAGLSSWIPLKTASPAPDGFGYTYQDETESIGGPTFNFIDISGSGANLGLNDDDNLEVTLPFNFSYYGVSANKLLVGNNGAVIFNPTVSDKVFANNICPLSSNLATNNLIAPWWDDWGSSGDVYTQTFGAAPNRYAVIQWNGMIHFGNSITSTTPVTFQLVLFETSNVILFQYLNTDSGTSAADGAEGTIGLRGDSAANSLQYQSCNSAVLTNGRAIRFQRSSITITKRTSPAGGANFGFSGDLGAFTLNDGDSSPVSYTLASRPFTVTESSIPATWGLASINCTSTLAGVGGFTGTVSMFAPDISARQVTIIPAPGDAVACTFNNSQSGTIIVQKSTTPASDPQVFTFTSTITGTPSFTLSTGLGPVSRTFVITPGLFSVAETLSPGWDLTGVTCSDGSPAGAINVSPGETVTCTFANTKRAKIIVDKATLPAADATSFDFSLTGGPDAINQTFSLTDAAAPHDSGLIKPGSYNLTETAVLAWDLSGAACDNGQNPSTGSINLTAGATVTCTFTNTKRGKIIIDKVTAPSGDPTLFHFSLTGGPDAINQTADLADATPPYDSGFIKPGSNYVVTETVPSTWTLTGAACTSGTPNNVTLSPGGVVTCTFNNQAVPGTLIVQKATNPASDPQVFTFTTNIAGATSFTLTTNPGPISRTLVISPGTYAISEDALPDWDLTASDCSDGSALSNLQISAGETVTCTITNTKRATLIVDKVTNPAGDPASFGFTLTGGTINQAFNLTDSGLSSNFLVAGSYNLTETALSGWDLTAAACSDGSPVDNIALGVGETVTCTFTNTKRGTIVIDKVTLPAGNTTAFTFTTAGLTPATFSLTDAAPPQTFANLLPGSYGVTETVPSNWTLTGASCTDGSPVDAIDVGVGEVVTCTFTNSAEPGTLIVQKVTTPTSDLQVFTFTTSIPTIPTFALDTNPASPTPVSSTFTISPGLYSISENGLPDWLLSGATCSDGSPIGAIDVAPAETVTCTLANTKLSRLIVDKVTNPAGFPTPFNFSLTGPANQNFSLADASAPFDTGFILPGAYSLTETVVSGWSLTTSCTNGSLVNNLVLNAGETVTCTFTNTAQPSQLTVIKDAVPNSPQDFKFLLITSSTSQFFLDDDSDPTLPVSQTFVISTGVNYSVVEAATPGWTLSNISCSGSASHNVQLNNGTVQFDFAPGQNLTCTFTNSPNTSVGSITIIKDAQPNSTQSFAFTSNIPNQTSFSLTDNGGANSLQVLNLAPGAYTVTEGQAAGWNLSSLVCTGDTGGAPTSVAGSTASIGLDGGEAITCTFTNQPVVSSSSTLYLPIIMQSFAYLPNLTSTLTVNTAVNPPLVTLVVKNIGNAPVNEGFWVDFYVNPTTPPGSLTGPDRRWQRVSSRGIAWQVPGPLAAGDSITLSSSGGFDPNQSSWGSPLPSGLYNFYALPDSFDSNDPTGAIFVEVQESNEADNESSATGLSISSLGLEINQSSLPDPAQFPPR